MAELVAQGNDPRDGWRRKLPARPVTLGRVPGEAVEWAAPWDRQISSLHAILTWDGQRLTVRRSPRGRNPIFFHGAPQDEFAVEVGDSFAIGKTIFTLEGDDAAHAGFGFGSTPDMELTCSPEELRQVKYIDADDRVEVLAALPDLIRRSPSDEELEKQVLEVLLRGIPRAGAVGVVRVPAADAEPEVRARAARSPGLERVPPSRRLIADALRRRQSVLYRWDRKDARLDITTNAAFDWALCAPLPEAPAPGWGLYVAGRLSGPSAGPGASGHDQLKSDLKFAEAAAGIFGALRQVRELQAEQMHVRASLRVAQEIQAGFFPRELPQPAGYEIAAVSRSADETGGDYYDVLPLASGRFGLVIADVCGHGLGPSLLMASVRAMLRGFSLREPTPAALVTDLNCALHDDLSPRHRFITLLYGALDPVAHQFHYANAGHGPVALHFRAANGVQSLCDDAARGLPLGILKDVYEPCAPVALEPGDLLVLGSDGLVETRREGEQFGMGRLTDFLLGHRERPLNELLDALIEETAAFHEHQRHEDDLTLLMVRRN